MAKPDLVIKITVVWWWDFYVAGLAIFCLLFRTVPNYDAVLRMAYRALRVNGKRANFGPDEEGESNGRG